MESREMWITPPKGLLEVNTRPEKSKKERCAMVRSTHVLRNQRKKGVRWLAKKVLHEMEEGHILEGLLLGDNLKRLHLMNKDFQLFKHECIVSASKLTGVYSKTSWLLQALQAIWMTRRLDGAIYPSNIVYYYTI